MFNHEPKFVQVTEVREVDGQTTLGRVTLTPDQTLLLVALA